MSKLSCEVCQDLLTLYVDDLCSNESKTLVEEHLENCSDCKDTYEVMRKDIKVATVPQQEKVKAKDFKLELGQKWKKFLWKKVLKILGIILGIVTVLGLAVYFMFFHDYVISGNDVEVRNVCQLSDGRIAYELVTKDGTKFAMLTEVSEDRGDVPIYIRGVTYGLFSKIDGENIHYKSSSTLYTDPEMEGEVWNYNAIYFGEVDDKDKILIWEEGMDVPKASEEFEKTVNEYLL